MSVPGCCVVAAPDCIWVCMFPDYSGLKSNDMLLLGSFTSLEYLYLFEFPPTLINDQDGKGDPWIEGLSKSLKILYIVGELQWHIHTVDIRTNKQS